MAAHRSDSAPAVRAMVLEAPQRLVEQRFARPTVGGDDALLRVEACGLCGTDHEQYSGALPASGAVIPGHETVGVIEAIGAGAAQRWGVAVGDRVAVEVFQSCRACAACTTGEYRRCERHGIASMYGFIPVDREPSLWGGYATHQYLGPDAMLIPIPDGLDPVTATLFNPLGAGIRWAATLPGTGPGDVVAVLGPGIRGLCSLIAARHAGAEFVLVTGRGPRDAERLALAERLGADLVVDVAVDDPVRALRDATGGRLADVVVDVTAKAPAAFGQAVRLAATGATVVVAGTRGTPDVPGFHPDHVVYKELTIIGALGVDVVAYRAAIDLLASGRIDVGALSRRTVGFDELEQLLRLMAGEVDGVPPVHGVLVPGA